jgi:hypothetical protein
MRKLLALTTALTLVLLISVQPAMAQFHPVVPDRTAVTFTYTPTAATSITTFALSYSLGSTSAWDALLSTSSGPAGTNGANSFRFGARYHLKPPGPDTDLYLTIQSASQTSPAANYLLLGTGFTHNLAPGLKAYLHANYSLQTNTQTILWNAGWQYELSRQASLVVGLDEATGLGYLGLNFVFASR